MHTRKLIERNTNSKLAQENGASLVEYALLVALVALMGIAAASQVGDNAAETFCDVAREVGDNQLLVYHGMGDCSGGGGGDL